MMKICILLDVIIHKIIFVCHVTFCFVVPNLRKRDHEKQEDTSKSKGMHL